MNIQEYFKVTREAVLKGLDKALKDFQVAALTEKKTDGRVLYDYITNSSEVVLEYRATVLSPKKFFFPQTEKLLEFQNNGAVKPVIAAKPLVLFGMRPCDLNAIKIMNEAFAEGNGDPNYLAKKEKTVVVGMDCKKICDKDVFCYKVNSHNAFGGFDIMLYEDGDNYSAEVVSEKGKNFLIKYFSTEKGSKDDIAKFAKEKEAVFGAEKQFKDLEKFPEIFEKNRQHAIWDQEGARCLSCGSCIMVCPSCYCFDVTDEWQLNLQKGERKRQWDACMLSAFAVVAGGENFRHSATARLHHRINRKFEYLMKKHGQAVCVGCGRCVRACLADISPKTIAEHINGEKQIGEKNRGGK